MTSFTIDATISYTPSGVLEPDDTHSSVDCYWERRDAGSGAVEDSGTVALSHVSGGAWQGVVDAGDSNTSGVDADFYYRIDAQDIFGYTSDQSAMTFGGKVAPAPAVQNCFSVPQIYGDYFMYDSYAENGESGVTIPSGEVLSAVELKAHLITDQYASFETVLIIESPEGTQYTLSLSDNVDDPNWTTGVLSTFSSDTSSGGIWKVYLTDSYGDGLSATSGSGLSSIELCFGP